jgi:hypothetical protein
MKRWGPFSLILIGILVISGASLLYSFDKGNSNPTVVTLPKTIAGIHITEAVSGQEAIDQVAQLHGKGFPLTSGGVGTYDGRNDLTIWVAGTISRTSASELVSAMASKIAESSTPFQPTGDSNHEGQTVYELVGMGQRHFYFQAGSLVIWLAADPPLADQAITDVLEFYR